MDALLQQLLAWKAVGAGLFLAALFLAERRWPAAPEPVHLRPAEPRLGRYRLLRNGGLWSINLLLSPLIVLPVTLWATQHSLDWRPLWWSGAGGLLLDLLLLDFLIYWWHRANHALPLLWRFHEIHHLDRFLDTTSALRFHFGELLLATGVRALAVILLAVPFLSVAAFEVLVLAATLFHHSNLRLPKGLERRLARLVITPSIHWVHHHAVRRDTDSNYGTLLSLWDPLFGSRSTTRRDPAMAIGVEGTGERSLAAMIVRPFRGASGRGRPG